MRDEPVRNLVCAAALVLLVAGCTPAPPRPAMVPLDENRYGYTEIDLGAGRYAVVYVTPSLRSSSNDASREADAEREKARAYDFALWRAAQIALERGYEAFAIEESERDADLSVRRERYYPYGYGAYHSRWYYGPSRYGWPYRYHAPDPYLAHPAYPYGSYGSYGASSASLLVTVRLTVREAAPDEPGAFDAAATATRLAGQYGNAVYPAR